MSVDGRCHVASDRRKVRRRQKTRLVTAAVADKETLNVGAELRLTPHNSDLLVTDLDTSFGSPYRRRPAATTGRPLATQVGSTLQARWLGGLLVGRRTSVSQIRGSIPGLVAAV